jgi:hypothetical protein
MLLLVLQKNSWMREWIAHPSAACCSADGQSGSFVPPAAASPPRGRKPSKDAACEALTATWCCCSGSCLICSVIVSPYSHTLAGCSKHRSVAASRRRRCTCARAPLTEWPSARDVCSPCWSACVLRVCSVRQNCVLMVVNSALTLRTIPPQKAASLTCLLCLEAAATLVRIPVTLCLPGKL